jgi:RsmE family RNA methyltransferase
MQSRRVWLPTVTGPLTCASVLQQSGVVLAEPTGVAPDDLTSTPSIIVIGPEGGFSPAELDAGLPRVRLGRHILRIETAALAAAASFLI